MNNYVAFGLGVVIGAAAGAGLTYCFMQDKIKKTDDTTSEKVTKDHKDAISTSAEELADYYIQQLRDLGCELYTEEEYFEEANNQEMPPYPDVVRHSSVNPIEEDEDEESEEENSDFVPVEPNPDPYEINTSEFGKRDYYEAPTISWYKRDHTMCDEDYDPLDDWKALVGDIEDKLMEANDSIYIRNEVQQCDYEILIYETSYKEAMGEEELGDMAD